MHTPGVRIHQCRPLSIHGSVDSDSCRRTKPPGIKSFATRARFRSLLGPGDSAPRVCRARAARNFSNPGKNKRARSDLPAYRFCPRQYLSTREINVGDAERRTRWANFNVARRRAWWEATAARHYFAENYRYGIMTDRRLRQFAV